MHIEKVVIVDVQKDNARFEFGPINCGKSAIVSGDRSKSSWLKAIIFGLGYSNKLSHIPGEFHSFNGSVELILSISQNDALKAYFTNLSINQFGDKISLRRSIQSQQIEYFLNDVRVERLDIRNFLQIFGFSQSFPFQYVLNSDDIGLVELSNSRDRLQWLKNCCGVDEFCAKRDKAKCILKETEEEIRKVDMLLMKLEVQLKIFASNETQKIYDDWIKREKELGHFKRLYRIKKLQADIQQRNADIDRHTNMITRCKNDFVQNVEKSKEIRRQLKSIVDKLNALKVNEQQYESEIERQAQARVTLESSIINLQSLVQQGSLAEDLSMQERQMYEEKIDQTNSQISTISEEIERIVEEKSVIDQRVNKFESQAMQVVLNCQQNQRLGKHFDSVAKRNEHLMVLIKRAKNAIGRENRAVKKLRAEIQPEVDEWQSLTNTLAELNEQLVQLNADDEVQSFHQQQEIFGSLESQQSELVEQNKSLLEKSKQLKLNLDQVYDKLRLQIGDLIFEGYKSMEKLMQRKSSNELKRGYYGLVIDNFTCEDSTVQSSIPSVMGKYLFYHIVDTPQTATKIISAFNAAKLPGEVSFFALSLIESDDSHKNDIISRLSFDKKFGKVFAKICAENSSNLNEFEPLADDTSKQTTMDSGYLECNDASDGTQSSCHGSFLDLYQQQQQLIDMDEATHYELCENSYRIDSTQFRINETGDKIDKQHQTMSRIQQVQSAIANITHEINLYGTRIRTKETEIEKREAKVIELTESVERYEHEMTLELLTEQEAMAVESIQTAIVDEKLQLQQVMAQINELQNKHDNVSEYYEHSLMSRYSVLQERSMNHSQNSSELIRQRQLLSESEEIDKQAKIALTEVRTQRNEIYKEYESKKALFSELEQQKSKIENIQASTFQELDMAKIHRENLITEANRLRVEKPYDATQIHNPDIVEMSEDDIDNSLSIARHQLKTYENTNSFDFNMLDNFKRERANLVRRRKELSNIERKIAFFMGKLEANIKTSIKSMFHNLAKQFSENFVKFVADGGGRLQLVEAANVQGQECSEIVQRDSVYSTGDAIGLNIFARFSDEEKSFDNLFGIERRVVALIFIISMQQLSPMPFYLCDCIEELIFEPYTQPFVSYLNELSNGSQIIATLRSHDLLNGPNFIDNTFRSTLQNGVPFVERISRNDEPLNQIHNLFI